MPPRRFSRYTYTSGFVPGDEGDNIGCLEQEWPGRSFEFQLDDREPFRFREITDNRLHRVVEGDTLFTLAAKFFSSLPRPSGLWFVIADFQPQPIVDPTVRLRPGALIVIPSIRTIEEDIFTELRREDSSVT